jgi:hypothetical protein
MKKKLFIDIVKNEPKFSLEDDTPFIVLSGIYDGQIVELDTNAIHVLIEGQKYIIYLANIDLQEERVINVLKDLINKDIKINCYYQKGKTWGIIIYNGVNINNRIK